jgi:hypothetical protein
MGGNYIIVNHWPSRSGAKKSLALQGSRDIEPKIIDLTTDQSDAKVITLGDLNDGPLTKA